MSENLTQPQPTSTDTPTYPYPPTAPTAPTSRKRSVPLFVAVLAGAGLTVVSCLGGVGVGAAGKAAPAPAASTVTVTKEVQAPAPAASTVTVTVTKEVQAPPVAPPAPKTTITEGTWSVGPDIPAGTYRTVGASGTCYWEITKSGSNGADIVENANGGGNLTVTLKVGEDFTTERCGTWGKM